MVVREDSVPANVANCVIAEALAFGINEDVSVVCKKFFDFCRLLLLDGEVEVFGQFGKIMTSGVVGLDYFVALGHVGDTSCELLEESLFNAGFDLGQDVARVYFEVFDGPLTEAFCDGHL